MIEDAGKHPKPKRNEGGRVKTQKIKLEEVRTERFFLARWLSWLE